MRATLLLLILAGLAACAEPKPVRVPAEQLRQPGAPLVEPTELARRTHELVNTERALRRLRPLRWSPLLSRVAEQHSEDMAQRGFFDHVTPEGRLPSDRAVRANATCGGQRSANVLENLAQTWLYRRETVVNDGTDRRVFYDWRTQDEIAEESVTRWIRSDSHREALLNRRVQQQGVGVSIRGDGQVLITQVMC
ncbi:MAG: CAP domain-containing protein [Bacteroidota bacterium]